MTLRLAGSTPMEIRSQSRSASGRFRMKLGSFSTRPTIPLELERQT